MRYVTTTDQLTALLRDVTRDRARARLALAEARAFNEELRAHIRDLHLELNVARGLLAYHGLTPPEETTCE